MTTKTGTTTYPRYFSTWRSYLNKTGAVYSSGDVSATTVAGSFSLSYEDGPQRNADGSPHWKRCQHERAGDYSYTPYSYKATSGMLTDYGTLGTWFTCLLPGGGSLANYHIPDQPLPALGTVYADHLNEIYGQVKPSMLGIENLASLFGGKSLFKSTETALRALLNLGANGKKSFVDAIKALAGMDLATQFSVKATVSDIQSSIDLFEGWRSHIAKLRARQSSDVLLHKTSKTNSDRMQKTCDWSERWSGLPISGVPHSRVFLEKLQASSTTTCFTRAKVRYTNDTLSVINYLQGALGLNRPLSSIWAIVPLSFLLDYVISIQTLCDELDSSLNRSGAVQQMLQVGETWTTRKRSTVFQASLPPGPCGGSAFVGAHTGCSIIYERSSFVREPLALSSVYQGWSAVGSVTPRKAATVAEIAFQIFA